VNPQSIFSRSGAASEAVAALVPTLAKPAPVKIGMLGVGLKMHFVWAEAERRFREGSQEIRAMLGGESVELLCPDTSFENPDEMLAAADKLLAEGISGLILFHGSYTAGEIGSQLGRWLLDHPMPLLSWAYPEPTGGRLTANSLCCQNFLLNTLHRMGVNYSWMFRDPADPGLPGDVKRFARCVRARSRLRHSRVVIVGTGRVPGFYDAECDELSVMRRFGLRFDRMGLEAAFDRAKKFSDADVAGVRTALTNPKLCKLNNVPDNQADLTIRLALGTLVLAAEGGHTGCALKCWPELFDLYGCAADGALTLLNDQGFPAADESDMNGLLTMMVMQHLTNGVGLPTLMDISLLDPARNVLGFWHCGGSATRLVREGTLYEARRHSILENANEETACGLLVEALIELGPVTAARYLSPDSSQSFPFEGDVVESPMAFRGSYAEVRPAAPHTAEQVMGTILSAGMDHHWVMGRGRFAEDLAEFNHWLGVKSVSVTHPGSLHGLKSSR